MKERDAKTLQKLAVQQAELGMDYVDLNIGPAGKIGEELMTWLVPVVHEVVDLPLALDTSNVKAIAAGLKAHKKGRPLINSIMVRPERMDALWRQGWRHFGPQFARYSYRRCKDRILGVLQFDNRASAGMFGQQDLELLTIVASQASLAIQNARLFKRLAEAEEHLAKENRYLKGREEKRQFRGIIGKSTAMSDVFRHKRLLALSSVENVGIILMGVGLGMVGRWPASSRSWR